MKNKSNIIKVVKASRNDNEGILNLLKTNPIVMEASYVKDRSPDYFFLIKKFPSSAVFLVKEKHTEKILGCVNSLVIPVMIRGKLKNIHYAADLNKSPKTGNRKIPGLLTMASVRHFEKCHDPFMLAFVNPENRRAFPILAKNHGWSVSERAVFSFTEIIPVFRYFVKKKYRFSSPDSSEELNEILKFIDQWYKNYDFYRPLEKGGFRKLENIFPGLNSRNIVVIKDREQIRGALLFYDPSPISNLQVVRYDFKTKMVTTLLYFIHKISGAFFSPPKEGETIRTLQIRYLAGEQKYTSLLIRYVSNLAREKKYHSVSMMYDIRTGYKLKNIIHFAYATHLFIKGEKQPPNDRPAYFDIGLI